MKPGQVYPGLKRQRRQFGDKIQRLKDDVHGAISVAVKGFDPFTRDPFTRPLCFFNIPGILKKHKVLPFLAERALATITAACLFSPGPSPSR